MRPEEMKVGHYYRVTFAHNTVAKNIYTVQCNSSDGYVQVFTRNGKERDDRGYCNGASSITEITEWDAKNPGRPKNNLQALGLLKNRGNS